MLDGIVVHLLAGGIGGTVGAVLTCPLEVVKVRLQSSQHLSIQCHTDSVHSRNEPFAHPSSNGRNTSSHPHTPIVEYRQSFVHSTIPEVVIAEGHNSRSSFHSDSIPSHNHKTAQTIAQTCNNPEHLKPPRVTIYRLVRHIIANEGFLALYKGLVPTLIGVLPSRAIYFSTYQKSQSYLSKYFAPDSAQIYLSSAAIGGFTASTLTNPIWFLKTRLQLDKGKESSFQVITRIIRNTWSQHGIRGFYKGVTASYVGISETALHFLIYENIKNYLLNNNRNDESDDNFESENKIGLSKLHSSFDMIYCMGASACSKTVATTLAYPHEVVRTRLREEGNKYHGFLQTLRLVVHEDGAKGLYRGLATHYVRQVPNSCFMIGTYECVVFLLQKWGFAEPED